MTRHFIIFLSVFVTFSKLVCGQVIDPFPYKFSSSIYAKIKIDSNQWKGGVTSSDLSFIGLHNNALIEWDKPRQAFGNVSKEDSLDFAKKYKPVNAKKYIKKIAKENQIIIFNEAHYNPRNRVFLTSLLKDLKKEGFKYFLAETFDNKATFKDNYKAPTLNLGYYSMEPQFGNLIREANKLNFILYPYEDTTRSNGKNREIGEAKNIESLLTRDPNAKIIIYCGFSHIYEDSVYGWGKAMAGRLKEFTGIDPFTIDQVVLSEKSEIKYSNPYYRIINANTYSILVDENGNPFHKRYDNQKVDALLYSPPTKYLNARPDWIFENGKTSYFLKSDSVKISFPLIAKVYSKEEDIGNFVVPIDIIEIKNEKDISKTAIAVFKKESFIIQLIDTSGKIQIIRVKNNRS
jgi:hypothetical protein